MAIRYVLVLRASSVCLFHFNTSDENWVSLIQGSILILNLRRQGGAGTPTSITSRFPGGLGRDTMGLTQLTRMTFERDAAFMEMHEVVETNDTRLG